MSKPNRSEVWWTNLDPVVGHETGKTRPALVISSDRFNHGKSGLVWVIPMTSVEKRIPTHVAVRPPEGGCTVPSFIKCEEVRTVSVQRLNRLAGSVSNKTMSEVEYAVSQILGFGFE